MSKYIDAVGLKIKLGKRLSDDERRIMEIAKETIDSMPTIDIVRCVECRYKGMEICSMYKLTKAGVLNPYDFCSYGERIDNE